MSGAELLQARRKSNLEQLDVAKRFGISQSYLSLLESGQRKITDRIVRRAISIFRLSPTSIPRKFSSIDSKSIANAKIAEDLAALGYMGFAHLRKKTHRKNPADILIVALSKEDLDNRILEALPWLILEYFDLDWNELIRAAKLTDSQNKLGFLTSIARKLAETNGNESKAKLLRLKEVEIAKSLLFREEAFCNASLTLAEKRWLKTNRTKEAKIWRLLTDLKIENLNYAKRKTP